MATRPNGPAVAVRAALALSCLSLWWFVLVAGDEVPVPGWWPWYGPIFRDILVAVALAAVYAVVVVERRSWLLATIVFIPIGGILYSLRCFWRLGGRLTVTDVRAVERSAASSPG
jgi:hypothetical protein